VEDLGLILLLAVLSSVALAVVVGLVITWDFLRIREFEVIVLLAFLETILIP
jgi:hypothetical protein